MTTSFPRFGHLALAVFILGFCSFYNSYDAYANSYEDSLLSALNGDGNAQFELARLYFVREDVPQNYIKAYAWSKLAAAQGHIESSKILSKLMKIMTSQQLMEGKALSAQLENRITIINKDNKTIAAGKGIDVRLKEHVVLTKPGAQNDGNLEEIACDGRFIAYSNGTVMDTFTGLMWANIDNGEDINWYDAKEYCENYIGGWHTDWRMPTLDEMAEIYNTGQEYEQECCLDCSKVKTPQFIKLSCCCLWSCESDGSGAAHFVFRNGFRGWNYQADYVINRVLPVRTVFEK